MSILPAELFDIFSQFESTTEPFELWNLASALKTFEKNNPILPPNVEFALRAEVFAFEFVGKRNSERSPWGTYFGPRFILGGEGCFPDIRHLDEDIFTYWKQRLEETKHPRIKARYADLIWDLMKAATGRKPDHRIALSAINLYIEDLQYPVESMCHVFQLERALNLAIFLKKHDKIEDIVNQMFSLHKRTSDPNKMGLCWIPLVILYEVRKRATLSEEQEREIINRMEGFLAQWAEIDSGNFNHSYARDAGRELAQIYRSRREPTEAQRIVMTLGGAIECFVRSASPLIGRTWLEKLHQDYLEVGLRSEADRVLGKMRELGVKAAEEMKPITSTIEIPTEEVNAHIDSLLEGGIDDCWNNVSACYILNGTDVWNQVRETQELAPLFSRIKISIGGELPRVQVGGVQDDEEGRFFLQASMQISIKSPFLSKVIKQMFESYALTAEDFVERLYCSPIFDAGRKDILTCGVERYQSGDFVSAIHILVPQIEHLLRTLLGSFGGTTSVRKEGVFREKDLGQVLSDPVMQHCFQTQGIEDIRRYFQALLTEQRGWNMRNQVCHGLPSSQGWFTRDRAVRLLHVLMVLSLFQPSEDNHFPSDHED